MDATTGHSVRYPCLTLDAHIALTYARSVFPLIFHSIKDEIPEGSRALITRLYQLWIVLFGTLIINMVACVFLLTSGSSDGARDLGASIGCVSYGHWLRRRR